jgi:hypothetical protein
MDRGFVDWLDQCRRDPQVTARAAAARGERVVGYVGNDIPPALILAANALPVRLRALGDVATPGADRFVESSFTPTSRSIVEQWLNGSLDHLDAVVFARGDDSGQRVYYYLCELQRRGVCAGPRPLLYDVASLARRSSFEHTLDSTRLLASQLGSAPGRLEEAITRSASSRRAGARGASASAAARALARQCGVVVRFRRRLRLARHLRRCRAPLARRGLTTSHAPARAAGRRPAARRTTACGRRNLWCLGGAGADRIRERGPRTQRDPFAAIAEEFHRRESPVLAMRRDGRWLEGQARDHRIDAVLVWLSEEDEALPWEIARQMRSLREANIPALLLARQPARVSAATLTQVMHFLRDLRKSP